VEYGLQRTAHHLFGRWRIVSRRSPSDQWRYEELFVFKWTGRLKLRQWARLLRENPVEQIITR
jgi:hypothetical protein